MLYLQQRGEWRTLIGLVEAWAAAGEPTPAARLAQARALVRVGLVDRAWARLQVLVEAKRASAETLALTAELFVAKQWPKRAREILKRGLEEHPHDERLKALWDRLSEPQTTPDLEAVEDDQADVASLATAAHHLIASGSHTRARTLLERAHKASPDNPLVADMLWALDGDFALEGSLAELVHRHGPDLAASLADFEEEPEHTESAGVSDVMDDREKQGSFPNLFRDLEPRTEMIGSHDFDDLSDEITKVSSMAELGSLDTITDQTFTGEHTEIQRVIERASLMDGPESDTAFDLASLQSDLTSPEVEDEDVVVVTRREEDLTSEVPPVPEERLVLDTPPPAAVQQDRRQPDEAATWVLPAKDDDEQETVVEAARAEKPKQEAKKARPPRSATPAPAELRSAAPQQTSPWWLVAFAAVFAISLALLLVVVGIQLVAG